ncbi:MAG: hypothetical protein CL450_04290 [Acidimicrobiaceae bacterium]|nr:hypothetical protein [Acidimicrobiaceae bacterium]
MANPDLSATQEAAGCTGGWTGGWTVSGPGREGQVLEEVRGLEEASTKDSRAGRGQGRGTCGAQST